MMPFLDTCTGLSENKKKGERVTKARCPCGTEKRSRSNCEGEGQNILYREISEKYSYIYLRYAEEGTAIKL